MLGKPARMCLLALVLVLAAASATSAQDSASFRERVGQLLRLTGAADMGDQVANSIFQSVVASMSQTNPNVPPRVMAIAQEVAAEQFGALFSDEQKLLDLYLPIYARHFSESELEELIRFYQTPIGQKAVRAMPAVVQESMQATQPWVQATIPRFNEELRRRLDAEGLLPR
jgi:uncharacterized protein